MEKQQVIRWPEVLMPAGNKEQVAKMARRGFLEKYNGRKLEWFHDLLIFGALVIIVFVVFRFVIGVSFVSGASMEPALSDGECVVYLRQVPAYHYGDVVSLWVPSGEYYVKRVVALAGDEVDLRQGQVYINGEPLEDSYGIGETKREEGTVIYPYTVREGNVFVLGDNRETSVDSRSFGEVSKRQIRGKIIFRIGHWYAKKVS